jgi:hypothetical protein
MSQNTFLYIIPQWFIFASVIAFAYGWVEQKKSFRLIGFGLLIALGFYAVFAIAEGYFVFRNFLTPEEIIAQEMEEEILEEMPLEGRILPAYWLFIASACSAIPGFFLEWKNIKKAKIFIFLSGLIALGGFFIIVGALRN